MSNFLLELFPMEVLHEIFDYLWTVDIFHAFFNINPYMNSVISNYNYFHINFRCCHRQDFDHICSFIQPNQIRSLILSNNDQTPEQFQLFFSKFHLQQLTRLRSMTIIDLEKDLLLNFLQLFNNDPNHCPHLQSFQILSEHYSYPELPKKILTSICSRPIKRLEIYKANQLNLSLLTHLQYLTIHDCPMYKLQEIFSSLPTLLSLQITKHSGSVDQWISIAHIPIRLKRLVLNLDVRISMFQLENLIIKLTTLKYLELQIIGNLLDLCDGYRWSKITEHLRIFDFHFTTEDMIITCPHLLIDTFRSSFWLETKCWFVAYHHSPSRIFTIPRFADRSASVDEHYYFHLPKHITLPSSHSFFLDCITNLTLSQKSLPSISSLHFPHVKTLSVPNLRLIEQLETIVDLSQVISLKIFNSFYFHELERLISQMMCQVTELHLRILPIENQNLTNGIKQILRLYIRTLDSISQFYRQFPFVEYLQVECAETCIQLRSILNYSQSHLSFISLSWSFDSKTQQSFKSVYKWSEKQTKYYSNRSKFTYRCHHRHLPTIHLWIQCNAEPSNNRTVVRRMSDRVLKNVYSFRKKLIHS